MENNASKESSGNCAARRCMGGGAFIGRDAKTDFTRWYSTSFMTNREKRRRSFFVVVATDKDGDFIGVSK
jgi:hypothetical protein